MKSRDLILQHFETLSPKLQEAARFIVDHPNEVVLASMRALAERAKTQPATLVRLAQHLGFAGWPELKDAFAKDLGLHAHRYAQSARSLVARGPKTDLAGELFVAQGANLAATAAQCGPALRSAAKLLQQAQVVHVAGFRASFPLAHGFVYGYRLFRDSVHLIDGLAGGLEMQLRPLARGHCVVVMGFAPYSRESLIVAQAAKAAKCKLVALTDSEVSPLARPADVTVQFAISSPSFFPSIVAAIATTEALLELVVAESGAAVSDRIAKSEEQLFASGAYVAPARRVL